MTILNQVLEVAGPLSVAATLTDDPTLRFRLRGAVPSSWARPGVVEAFEAAVAEMELPRLVVLVQPDVVVAEILLRLGHEVVLVAPSTSREGDARASLVTAQPDEVTVADVGDAFERMTVFNSGLLVIGVSFPSAPMTTNTSCLAGVSGLWRDEATYAQVSGGSPGLVA